MRKNANKILPVKYSTVGSLKDYNDVMPLPAVLMEGLRGLDYVIYGGYVRDLIAKKHNPKFKEGFKDIDILLLSRSFNKILKTLESHGYQFSTNPEDQERYKHWGAVSHIYTLTKAGEVKIQLACALPFSTKKTPIQLRDALLNPVMAVDIRCCGVAITPNGKVVETLSGAFNDCREMRIIESPYRAHKVNLKERIKKLKSRGWT